MEHVRDLPRLAPRRPDSHKGDFGHALVVAGSRGMMGAACLATEAVLRSGAGLVTLACPEGMQAVAAVKLTCAMTHPLPETPEGTLSEEAVRSLMGLLDRHDVVAIGPGLTQTPETAKFLLTVIPRIARPLVVDADALNVVAQDLTVLESTRRTAVLTPHPGEMSRLARKSVEELKKHREEIAFEFARRFRVVLVLKGHRTVITDGERVALNETGNPGMATAGAGDVLTGVITGLLAQGLSGFDAARLGAHLHGLAGDLAVQEVGEVSLIATDILDWLPQAFLSHQQGG